MTRALPCSLLTLAVAAAAADWPRFRGPNGSGVSDAAGLPVEFGPQKNVIWKTPLPPGHSSPVLAGNRVFLTAWEGDKLLTICLDRDRGQILWQREIIRTRAAKHHPNNSPASPSPVTDGSNVYVFFSDFGLASYAAGGAERWKLPLGPFRNLQGMGASPVLYRNLVLMTCDQEGPSFLIAVDKDTGAIRWRRDRSEMLAAGFGTPVVFERAQGGALLIVPGSFQLAAYWVETGEKAWWVGGLPFQPKASPVVSGSTVFYNIQTVSEGGTASVPPFEEAAAKYDKDHDGKLSREEIKEEKLVYGGFPLFDSDGDGLLSAVEWNAFRSAANAENALLAVRADGRGDVSGTNVQWKYTRALPNVPSPLVYQDVLYLLKEGGIFSALDPATGAVLKQGRLAGALDQYFASPVAADGKIYLVSQSGHAVVVKAGREWEVLAVNDLDETCFATPALAGGRIYLRTRTALYCFGVTSPATAP